MSINRKIVIGCSYPKGFQFYYTLTSKTRVKQKYTNLEFRLSKKEF